MLGWLARLPYQLALWLEKRRAAAFAIIMLGALLASPSLLTKPVADDLLHELSLRENPGILGLPPRDIDLFRFASGDPARAHALMNEGVFPWWTDPTVRLAFFRPLSGITHWIDWHWLAGSPRLMHLQSLAWYGALLAVLALVYRRFAPPSTALLALLLYAIDDAHAPAVSWIANRNAIIAMCFAMLAVGVHDAWRKTRRAGLRWLSAVLFGLALLAGETAITGVAYFVSYALFLERGPLRVRASTLLGPALVLIAWRVAYVNLGYGVSGSGVYIDPGSDPFEFAKVAVERVPVLLLAAVAVPWADLWEVYALVSSWAAPAVWCFALVVLSGVGLLLKPLLRRSATSRFWAAATVLSALPAASTFPHDRMLLGITVGWMALLAEYFASFALSGRRAGQLAASGLVLVHLLLSPALLAVRAASVDQLDRWLSESIADLPAAAERGQVTVVLLNPPLDPLAAYLPLYLQAKGLVRPQHFVWLASGLSTLQVRRLDSRTLSLRPDQGYLTHSTQLMLRSTARPFALGHTVRLDAATFVVTALTSDGRPAEVSVRFLRALEDPALRIFRWDGDGYVRFAPPSANSVAVLPAADFLRLLSR
jgi:hypothetical protein